MPQRLPIVNNDDGTWGDIIRQYIMKEHYNDDTDNAINGSHKTITIRPGTTAASTAPLTFNSGSLMTTPEAGAVEFNTDSLYLTTTTGTVRKKVAIYDDSSGATGDIYYRDSGGSFVRLPAGSDGDSLSLASGLPSWSNIGISDKVSKSGDTITGNIQLTTGATTGIRFYNTADTTTNTEYAQMYWGSNIFQLFTNNTGTGTSARTLRLGGAATYVTIGVTGVSVNRDSTSITQLFNVTSAGLLASAGTQHGILIDPTVNQSGTAGYTMLKINPTESATGSGSKYLADFQLGGSSKLTIDTAGKLNWQSDTSIYRQTAGILATDAEFKMIRTSSTSTAFSTIASGDSTPRYLITADGKMAWGDGTATRDTNLYRSAADTLKTDDAFIVAANTNSIYLGDNTNANNYASFNNRTYVGYDATGYATLQGGISKGIKFNVNNGTFGSGTVLSIDTSGNITNTGDTTFIMNGTTNKFIVGGGSYGSYALYLRNDSTNGVSMGFNNLVDIGGTTGGLVYASGGAKGIGFAAGHSSNDALTVVNGDLDVVINGSSGYLLLGTVTSTSRLSLASATTAAGGIAFGTDVNLYRSAANTLKTDDAFITASTIAAGNTITAVNRYYLTNSGSNFPGLEAYADTDSGFVYHYFYRKRATGGQVLANDVLGAFGFRGHDGTSYINGDAARIQAYATEDFTSSAYSAHIDFVQNNIGSMSATTTWRFAAGGVLQSRVTGTAGGLSFGSGSTQDTNLYRSAANTLKTDGNIVAAGSTVGNTRTEAVTRTLPTAAGNTVEIGYWALTNGAATFDINITVPSSSFGLAKQYKFPVTYNGSGGWKVVNPISSTGVYSGNDYALELNMATNFAYLRIRRVSGGTAGTAYVQMTQTGLTSDPFTATSATATPAAVTGIYAAAQITQALGLTGIGTLSPATGLLTVGTNTTANTGGIYFGTDTNLYRSGTNALTTGGSLTTSGLTVNGAVTFLGDININTSFYNGINIGTGTYYGNIAIGGASAGYLGLRSNTSAANAININASAAAGGIDIDAGSNGITLDSTGAISIDSTALASNFGLSANSGSNAVLTLSATNSGAGAAAVTVSADETINLNAASITSASTLTSSSGTQNVYSITPTINQSGTASYTALLVNPTESATGSGSKNLLDLQVGGVSKFKVDNTGLVTSAGGLAGGFTPRVSTLTVSGSTYTPNCDTTDIALISSPAAAFTVANPSGTAQDGQELTIRVASSGTGYAPTWGANYLASGMTVLPTSALPASKTVTFKFVYYSSATKWVLLAYDSVGI